VEVAGALSISGLDPRHISMRQGGGCLTWPLRQRTVSIAAAIGRGSTTRCTMGEIRS